MHLSQLLPILSLTSAASASAIAALNGRCTGSQATGLWGISGICISTSTCNSFGGEYKSGACPNDPADVKCCLVGRTPDIDNNPCGGASYCDWTGNGCDGRWISNECPGGSNYRCCRLSGTQKKF